MEPEEFTEDAAARELEEETHVRGLTLSEIGLFSGPDRDPRGWAMSCAYAAIAQRSKLQIRGDDDAAEAAWFQLQYHMSQGTLALKLSREEELPSGPGFRRSPGRPRWGRNTTWGRLSVTASPLTTVR